MKRQTHSSRQVHGSYYYYIILLSLRSYEGAKASGGYVTFPRLHRGRTHIRSKSAESLQVLCLSQSLVLLLLSLSLGTDAELGIR